MLIPILDFLSLRTFSSVWYWLAVAVVWATVSNRPMGVPYDMVWRAKRDEGEARTALEAVARTFARRLVHATGRGGPVAVALGSAALTALVLLGFAYRLEFAQGLALIALPLAVVGWMSALTARRIDGGADPVRHLRRLRAGTHAVALVALFVTAFWGMYANLVASVL